MTDSSVSAFGLRIAYADLCPLNTAAFIVSTSGRVPCVRGRFHGCPREKIMDVEENGA